MYISKEEYKEILQKQDKEEITLYINTAGFRKLFTLLGDKMDKERFYKDIGENLDKQVFFIKSILFFGEPLSVILNLVIAVILFDWYAIIVVPLIILFWSVVKTKASSGKQEITSAIIFLVISFLINIIFPELSFWLRLFIFTLPLIYFFPKLLYYLTAKFTFSLLERNYEFFKLCYDPEFPRGQEDLMSPAVWYIEKK
jgi:hypothetical protein